MAIVSSDASLARRADAPSALPAIGCKLASAAMLACMFALIKMVGDDYPTGQIVFVRSLFAMIPVLWLVHRMGGLRVLRTSRPGAHLWRSIAGLCSLFLSFSAVTMLPLGLATALGYTAPLFITLLAFPLLRERIRYGRWSATVVGFLGMLLLVHPGAEPISSGIVVALCGAVATALALISIRKMADTEADVTIVFYFTVIGTLVGAATLPFGAVMPGLADLPALMIIGLLGGGAQILLTKAYSMAPASLIAPCEYATLVVALILGLAVWGEFPTPLEMSGILVIALSNFFLVLVERPRRAALK
jgi:drug/metabolite transporter (DMT)-like permease